MIIKFEIFLEKHEPLKGMCGTTINGKNYDFTVKKIIDFAEKNYEISEMKVKDLIHLSLFKDIDIDDEPGKGASMLIKGKWKKSEDMTDKEWKKFKEEQHEIIMMADLKYPIILTVDDNDKVKSIIDGNHRVKKAHMKGIKNIKAYKIPEKDIVKKFNESKKRND